MYQVGDKVIVKARSKRPFWWNNDGLMDKYMGTIQKIERIDQFMFVYLKGCEDWRFDLEDDLMPFPEAGDRIKIRGWEDMKEQYGINLRGDFEPAGKPTFYSEMQYLCGKTFAVEVYGDSIFIHGYKIDPYMIDEVFKRRERMISFGREQTKEIPASEAMKILREKFGCEVKLVEDK